MSLYRLLLHFKVVFSVHFGSVYVFITNN